MSKVPSIIYCRSVLIHWKHSFNFSFYKYTKEEKWENLKEKRSIQDVVYLFWLELFIYSEILKVAYEDYFTCLKSSTKIIHSNRCTVLCMCTWNESISWAATEPDSTQSKNRFSDDMLEISVKLSASFNASHSFQFIWICLDCVKIWFSFSAMDLFHIHIRIWLRLECKSMSILHQTKELCGNWQQHSKNDMKFFFIWNIVRLARYPGMR